ncbi:hypothetical protein [Frankia sp. BMG5.23]|uniref:hypothetical protein n=1 Tax=Frankia sp. BMG5.23 TaxID=683305 RepID=UPI000460FE78|nr:hypothetical protein [Frankia sp. BMG5.23]KDA44970.1 hypothetical protein BMG523Draft_00095 [Frankia sp. BMG5.23]
MRIGLVLLAVALAVVIVIGLRRRLRVAWDGDDLTGWHPAHRDPSGDVWAVTPPCGDGLWTLYAPGAPTGGPYPYQGATWASTHVADDRFGGDHDRLRLADVEGWMRPWVERVSAGRVVDMAEGWSAPYGPGGTQQEYVIYARVVAG